MRHNRHGLSGGEVAGRLSTLRRLLVLFGAMAGLALAAEPTVPVRFNVRDYGAVGDGRTKDTAAIARAIAACAQAGGGTVEFPAGQYLTGTIQLRSHLTLMVGAGATILGSPDVADYPIVPNPWGEDDWQGPTQMSALIHADGAEHITIAGPGIIDGQGEIWWKRLWFTEKNRSAKRNVDGVNPTDAEYVKRHGGRPRLIRLVNCQHVRVENITLQNSPRWTLHPLFCDYVTVSGVTILNPKNSSNTDGINPESCRHVHISNCHIDTGDDAITLKSGYNAVGRRKARPTENVTITNCTFVHAHGGIVIGSEMSGDVRNVTATNCVFQGTEKGIRIKSNRERGGVVEHIVCSNLVMEKVVEPINIVNFYYSSDTPDQVFPVNEGRPRFRDIQIRGVTATGATRAGQIVGLAEMPIEGITLSDLRIDAKTGFVLQNVRSVRFDRVQIDTKTGPAISGAKLEAIEIDGLRTATPHAGVAVVDLTDVRDLWLRGARAPRGTETFLTVRGATSAAVVLLGNDLKLAREAVRFTDGADRRILTEN